MKNKWIIYFIIIIICWIPAFIAFCPVIINYDGPIQIYAFAIKGIAPSTKQPIISTIIFSTFYKLGIKCLNSATLGMMCFSIFQMSIMAGIFAYTTKFIYKETENKILTIISLIFYAMFPINQVFPLMTTKDILFSGLALIFVINLYKIPKKEYKIKECIFLIIIGVLMLLFRNNAVYAIIISLPFMIITLRKNKKKCKELIIVLVIMILLYQASFNLLLLIVNGQKDNDKEKMSVVSQAVARVSKEKMNELTQEEKDKIEYYFGDINNLAKVYKPNISDPTKAIIEIKRVEENKIEFYKFFIKLGLKYPLIYIDSFLDTTKNYWYIHKGEQDIELNTTMITDGKEASHTVYDYNLWPELRNLYKKIFSKDSDTKISVLYMMFQPAIYFYILIACILYAIYVKDVNSKIQLTYLISYFLTCFLGPCSIIRYVYINVISTPLIIALLTKKHSNLKEEKN